MESRFLAKFIPSNIPQDESSMPHITSSLTALAFAPGVLKTTTPKSVAFSIGTLFTPAPALAIADKLLPNSKLFWFEKCGHAPMMEHPVEFANTCIKWLNNHQ